MKRRSIVRGCDRVTLVRAPDPLDVTLGHKPTDMLHLTAAKGDGYGGCSWTVLLTLTGAKRLHAALGELLKPRGVRRRKR